MDNELIVIIGENMIMGPKWFLKICSWNHFREQCLTTQEILLWNECHPPTQLLSTTLYIYVVKNWGALKINNY
jgi:hypothetical protein